MSARRAQGSYRAIVFEKDGGAIAGELALARNGIHGVSFWFISAIGQGVVEPDARAFRHDLTAEQVAQGLGSADAC